MDRKALECDSVNNLQYMDVCEIWFHSVCGLPQKFNLFTKSLVQNITQTAITSSGFMGYNELKSSDFWLVAA